MNYIERKIAHMNRFGIQAERSETGAAMPTWRKEQKAEERKRLERRQKRIKEAFLNDEAP